MKERGSESSKEPTVKKETPKVEKESQKAGKPSMYV